MPDKDEIEIKFLIDDLNALRNRIIALGAEKQSERYEWNIRLDTEQGNLITNGKMLRIRRTETQGETKHVVTVKAESDNDHSDASYRVRREIEFDATGGEDSILALFSVLGFEPTWHYEKYREVYIWREVEIDLDHMPFGWFAEIEGPPDELEALISELEWAEKPRVLLSYQEIYLKLKDLVGLPELDLTFENFRDVQVQAEWIVDRLVD